MSELVYLKGGIVYGPPSSGKSSMLPLMLSFFTEVGWTPKIVLGDEEIWTKDE